MIYQNILIVLYGITILSVQIILIRELLSVLGGNELSIGLVFLSWFFWTACGSFTGGKYNTFKNSPVRSLFVLSGLIVFIIPVSVLCARLIPVFAGTVPGEIIGILPMFFSAFLVLFPFCFCSGLLFPILSRFHMKESKGESQRSVGYVYFFEGIGAMTGGLLLSFVLLRSFSAFSIALISSVCIIILILVLIISGEKRGVFGVSAAVFSLSITALFVLFKGTLEDRVNQLRWSGNEVLESVATVYSELTVTRSGDQVNFFSNGLLMFSSNDPLSAEESVHYGMLQHPAPETVLLVGGGMNGGLRELLEYKTVKHIDVVEIDNKIFDLSEKYLSNEELPGNKHEMINYIYSDPRYYLRSSDTKYDVIIYDLPDPTNSLINRLYTKECFSDVKRSLTPAGVFSFSLTSSENYLNDELKTFLGGIKKTLDSEFPETIVFPGNNAHFFASQRGFYLTVDPDLIANRMEIRGIRTDFVHSGYFSSRLSYQRVVNFERDICDSENSRINTDLNPVGFYYTITLWGTYFSQNFRNLMRWFYDAPYKHILFFILLIAFSAPVLFAKDSRPVLFASYTVGLSLISLEMIVLLSYQSFFGYIYHHISILIALFMAGLALGAFTGLKIKRKPMMYFRIFQIMSVILPLILIGILIEMQNVSQDAVTIFSRPLPLLLILAVTGFTGGIHFQTANTLFIRNREKKNQGLIYAVDLFGAAAGIMIVSILLIPISGLILSCFELSAINLFALVFLFIKKN